MTRAEDTADALLVLIREYQLSGPHGFPRPRIRPIWRCQSRQKRAPRRHADGSRFQTRQKRAPRGGSRRQPFPKSSKACTSAPPHVCRLPRLPSTDQTPPPTRGSSPLAGRDGVGRHDPAAHAREQQHVAANGASIMICRSQVETGGVSAERRRHGLPIDSRNQRVHSSVSLYIDYLNSQVLN